MPFVVAAACIGTFVLAESGLLDTHRATTTWWLAPLFRKRYPNVELDESNMIVKSGRFVTAGAALGHLDLALWLIGPNVRLNLPTDLIQPYALIGGGYMGADFSGDSNDTEHGGFARMGFGVEFYPWEHIAIDSGITYVVPVGDDIDDLKWLSIHWGLLYRF